MILLPLPRNSCIYKIGGTDTLRLASSKLPNKTGTNMQNLEKSMRALYLADGYKDELLEKCINYLEKRDLSIFTEEELRTLHVMVQTDQAGAEALVVAYLCRHGNFRELFLNGIKSHVFVAMHVFADEWQRRLSGEGLDIKFDITPFLKASPKVLPTLPYWKELKNIIAESDNWPASERYYYIAKMICHASNYGMKAGAFQINVLEKSRGKVVLTKQQAEYYLSTYHNLFPEIHEWHYVTRDILEKTRTLHNLFGFPRRFEGTIDDNTIKSAYAFVPQSTVGTITNIAYTNIQEYIEEQRKRWDMLANTHDSYMGQSPIGTEREFGSKQKEFIEIELINFNGEKFRMRSETQFGFNWAPHKRDKNPIGLVTLKGL